ncbi:MAG: hypothetical protein HND56_07510 [Pseudomonadota bacterium]|nr:hypothetical protein [Pseudomonadota bacterium]QKK05538.1 MAG: hypothetical protein HND56_07510 [Pseudomonadota bacterium]
MMKTKIIALALIVIALGLALFLFRNAAHQTQNSNSIERGLNAKNAAAERQNAVPVRPAQPGNRAR